MELEAIVRQIKAFNPDPLDLERFSIEFCPPNSENHPMQVELTDDIELIYSE